MKKIFCLAAATLPTLNAWSLPNVVIRDVSGKPQTNVPVTFAQAFPKGTKFASLALASGSSVYPTQIELKRVYNDGSAKHVIISSILPALTANQSLTLELRENAAIAGIPVSITSTEVPDVVVQFSIVSAPGVATVVKQISLKDLAVASPTPKYWLRGPVMAEALYEGAPKTVAGLLPDNFLNVQFHVRYYPAAKLSRVSVITDNTWKSFRSNVKYAVKILSAGKVLYQNDTVTHFHDSRWKKDFYLGIDGFAEPEIIPDVPYLITTGLIPRYAAGVTVNATSLKNASDLWNKSNHEIMGNGPITPYFPQTGGREDIGLYPGWAARYLFSMDSKARAIFYSAGDLSGSFSVHIRESKEKRIISIEDYPTATLLEAAAGSSTALDRIPVPFGSTTTPYTVDCAHQASFVYLPYLLSGDLYYLEELYHWADFNVLEKNFEYRKRNLGLLYSDQSRGQAWALRTIADAAAIAPDDHPEKAYFDRIVLNNLQYYDTAVVSFSALGLWGEDSNLGQDGGRPDPFMASNVHWYTSPWMSDFLTLVMDHVHDLGYTKAASIRNHLLKSAIGRVTSSPDFNPYDGAPYHLAVSDVSGHSYSTWSEVWNASFSGRTDPKPTKITDTADCAHGYPYIMRAALTAAIRDSLLNGKQAYQFIDAQLPKTCFSDIQSWALVPNAGDKALLKTTVNFEAPKKKVLYPHVSILHHNGRTSLVLERTLSRENAKWRVTDLKGAIIQTSTGEVCDLPPPSLEGGIRFFLVSTRDGNASGIVPPIAE